jgi:quercetin dioxygenase-like cupin family protein
MRLRVIVAAVGATAAVVGVGVAFAAHAPELDPASVPTGFFVTHNHVADVSIDAIARAVKPDGADVLMAHLRFPANQVFAWHTHPGPVVVTVRRGSLTHQFAEANTCRSRTYVAGEGFVDPGFGHVHRVIAGPEGADIYSTLFMPPGSERDLILASAPEECS